MSFQKYLSEHVLNELAPIIAGARIVASNPTVRNAAVNYASQKFKTSITNNHSSTGKYSGKLEQKSTGNSQTSYNHQTNVVRKTQDESGTNRTGSGNTYNITNNHNYAQPKPTENETTPIKPEEPKEPDNKAGKEGDENKKPKDGFFTKSGRFIDTQVSPRVGRFGKWLTQTTEKQLSN